MSMIIYILIIIYINDILCKCNRLDKCGYHYTPRQYFEDNPWLKEDKCSFVHFHRKNERTPLLPLPHVVISPSGRSS